MVKNPLPNYTSCGALWQDSVVLILLAAFPSLTFWAAAAQVVLIDVQILVVR